MSYNGFDASKPDGADNGTAVPGTAKVNDNAVRDMIAAGMAAGFAYSQSGGTAGEPTTILLTSGAHIVKLALTWSGGNPTAITVSKSTDTGSTYDTVGSGATFTFDSNGELTATTNFGGFVAKLLPLLGKVKTLISGLAAHIAGAGTDVHELGTMSTQGADAVAITGGTATLTYEREGKNAIGSFSGSKALDWNAGGLQTATITGSGAVFTHTYLPSGKVGYVTLDLTNAGLASNLFSGCKFAGGSAPTLTSSGRDIVALMCHDGSTVTVVGALLNVS